MSMFHELMMRKKEQIMYATIKGTLTESPEGVFSGFSTTSYLTLQQQVSVGQDTKLDIVVKIKSSQLNESSAFLGTMDSIGLAFRISGAGKITFYLGNGSNWIVSGLAGTTTLSANTDYYARVKIDNGVITTYISTDGTTWTQEATTTVTFSQTYNYEISLGTGRLSTTYFVGTIGLNNSYIKLGSTKYNLQAVVGYTVVGSPTIVDGVVSGFSSANYLQIANVNNFKTNISFEFKIAFETSNVSLNTSIINSYDVIFRISYSKLEVVARKVGGQQRNCYGVTNLTNNTKYYAKIRYTLSKLELSLSTDDINYNLEKSIDIELNNASNDTLRIGYETQTIYMNECYIKFNNKLWFNGQQA